MKSVVLGAILIACASQAARAQSAGAPSEFEVASVKPGAAPAPVAGSDGRAMMIRSGCSGGPGSSDPGRYACQSATLSSIIASAYELKRYQYSFPSWMDSAYFEIAAKVPAGATKEQFRLMKQRLLAERFKLAAHFEKRETQIYELVVGKDGPKLKESQPEPAADPNAPPPDFNKLQRDGDGIPIMPRRPGISTVVMMSGGGATGPLVRFQMNEQSTEQLASMLSNQLGKPVIDATVLKGKYDITLTCSPDGMGLRLSPAPGSPATPDAPPPLDAAPTIFVAVQQQLGLKLEQKKGPVDFLVVDRVEKTPVEN
jgi:uncharacterized protein (TIGR03435 family)